MPEWLLSKFSPALVDGPLSEFSHEWVGILEIGKSYRGRVLTEAEYLATEARYIGAMLEVHALVGAPPLMVRSLEDHTDIEIDDRYRVSPDLREGQVLQTSQLPIVIAACLRRLFWCRLESDDPVFFIHFGYDLLTYLGASCGTEAVQRIADKHKLFIKEVPCSPHHPDYDIDLGTRVGGDASRMGRR